MDKILNLKATGIEVGLTLFLFYFFPLFSCCVYGIPILIMFYKQSKMKSVSNLAKTSMNAALYNNTDKFSFKEVPIPKYGPDEVFVEVKGASINPIDYKMQTSKIPFMRWVMPLNIGRDFAGTIIEIGENVKNFNKGDNIYGKAKGGSLQEYTTAHQSEISLMPRNMSHVEAASIALAGGTSLQCLKWFKTPTSNDKILIIGASGGTGSLGVQIAKSYGATVYGVCSTQNTDLVKSLGCDHILDYRKTNYLDDLKDVSFDLIYDTVTSPDDQDQEEIYGKYLSPNGYYVCINGSIFQALRGFTPFEKRKNFHHHLLRWKSEDLSYMAKLVEDGKLKPSKCEIFKLSENEVNEAFDKLKSRRTVGKLCFEL